MENQEKFICEFCNKECKSISSLRSHIRLCKLNPNRVEQWNKGKSSWSKGLTKESDERVKKNAENAKRATLKKYNGKNWWFGRHHTEETKEKMRNTFNKRNNYSANYNQEACSFVDDLNEMFNWKLQHAKNGGEVIIGGYYLDGYDKELNIAFEYDEKKHYDDINKNILCEHDYKRMCFIHTKTDCRFFRYNEKLNLLYEVTDFEKIYEIKVNKKSHKNFQKEKEDKLKKFKATGQIRKDGVASKNIVSKEEWERRKNLLLNAKTDMTKFGWIVKMIKETNLTKRIIENTLKHFPEVFENISFKKNVVRPRDGVHNIEG